MRRATFLGQCAIGVLGAAAFSDVGWASDRPADDLIRVRLFGGAVLTRAIVTAESDINVNALPSLAARRIAFDAPTASVDVGGKAFALDQRGAFVGGPDALRLEATTTGGTQLVRSYPGRLFFSSSPAGLTVVDEAPLERYVTSTLVSEIGSSWPLEAIRAQAIANRTYAVRRRLHRAGRPYDVTDDTTNQVFRGLEGIVPIYERATQATAGRIVAQGDGTPADVFYSSTCGGHTAAVEELTGRPGPPYLGGVLDADASGRSYCQRSAYFAWKNSVALDDVARIIDLSRGALRDLTISARWPDGRVREVSFATAGAKIALDGRAFYARASGVLGYKVLPSTLFEVSRDGDRLAFTGHGVGHGVGLCQWGARGRADAGQSAEQILDAYFPGTRVG